MRSFVICIQHTLWGWNSQDNLMRREYGRWEMCTRFWWKPKQKSSLQSPRCKLENTLKQIFKEIRSEGVEWNRMARHTPITTSFEKGNENSGSIRGISELAEYLAACQEWLCYVQSVSLPDQYRGTVWVVPNILTISTDVPFLRSPALYISTIHWKIDWAFISCIVCMYVCMYMCRKLHLPMSRFQKLNTITHVVSWNAPLILQHTKPHSIYHIH